MLCNLPWSPAPSPAVDRVTLSEAPGADLFHTSLQLLEMVTILPCPWVDSVSLQSLSPPSYSALVVCCSLGPNFPPLRALDEDCADGDAILITESPFPRPAPSLVLGI